MRYVATGRIHPERGDIRFSPIEWKIPEHGRAVAQSDSSQVTILLDLTSIDGFVTAYIAAEHFAHIVVGALGFSLGSGYSVELIQVTEEDGTPHVFGVRPTGDTPAETLGFEPHGPVFNRASCLRITIYSSAWRCVTTFEPSTTQPTAPPTVSALSRASSLHLPSRPAEIAGSLYMTPWAPIAQ